MRKFKTEKPPEALGIEDIPDRLVKRAVRRCIVYGTCPECGTKQFIMSEPGEISEQRCFECGGKGRVLG